MTGRVQKTNAELAIGRHIIGWRERVALPDLCIAEMAAKIDTGARTSALHALDLRTDERDGEEWVSFHVPHLGERRNVRHHAKVLGKSNYR